ATSLLYESPHRLAETLRDLSSACGAGRAASVSRELSKLHEETVRGTLGELAARFTAEPARGEVVVVVGPRPHAEDEEEGPALLGTAGVRAGVLAGAPPALGAPRNVAHRAALAHPEHDDD